MRTYIKDLKNKIDEEVTIAGWVNVRRDHGKLIFIDLRDRTGLVQMVALPNHAEASEMAGKLRSEWVIEVKGKVNKRPDNMVKEGELNGELEIEILEIKILNEAETPPFDILSDGKELGEENRLKYRYLDLRRPRMTKNIKIRGKIVKFIRDELEKQDFTEIETSILSKSTPEGARDFVVPSRVYPGSFYALPQAPQQYKQLLMMGGFEKYFQIARCFRDEDTRSDRQPEFTQMDLEMSFVTQEEIMKLNEELLIRIVEKNFPKKTIQEKPFPRISYKEAMEKYGTDRPDMRKDKEDLNLLAFCWVVDFPFFEKTKDSDNPQAEGEWTFTHNPFSAPKDEYMDDLMNKNNIGGIIASQYDVALNGFEVGGGAVRIHDMKIQEKVWDLIGFSEEQKQQFKHYYEAFKYGVPPHGGLAPGIDRLMMVLLGEKNLKEVTAFPLTSDGRDPMLESPASVSQEQLDELGLSIKK